jgi:hypothetical protein
MAKRLRRQTFIQRSRSKGAEEKATYHQVTGAGKSRIRRRFFELSDADVDAIVKQVDRGIEEGLKKSA